MRAGTLHRAWTAARKSTGLEGFTFHDGRHFHLTTYGALGATEAELLARGGHSNRSSSKIYQHANPVRQEMLAEALSRIAEETAAHLSGGEKSHGSRTTPMPQASHSRPWFQGSQRPIVAIVTAPISSTAGVQMRPELHRPINRQH